MGFLEVLKRDKKLIIFREELLPIGKSVAGVMFLSQLIYWDEEMKGEFYKPIEPSDTIDRKSWCEELPFSPPTIRKAIKVLIEQNILEYRFDGRFSWFKLNREELNRRFEEIYGTCSTKDEDIEALKQENREFKEKLKSLEAQIQKNTITTGIEVDSKKRFQRSHKQNKTINYPQG